MEQKAITVDISASEDGIFEGYGAVFGNIDSYNDILHPGAFSKTLQERKDRIKVLWNHDSFAPPVGKLLDIYEDGHGLYFKAKLLTTPRGMEILQGMRDGVIDSMSIGYTTIKHDFEQRQDNSELRHLREVRLYEISPVNFPANEAATITHVKRQHEAEALMLQLADYLQQELKAGRTLSEASLKRIRAALHSIDAATDELQSLIDTVEPKAKALITPSVHVADEPKTHSPATQALVKAANWLQQEQKKAELLAEFRAYGASIGVQYE